MTPVRRMLFLAAVVSLSLAWPSAEVVADGCVYESYQPYGGGLCIRSSCSDGCYALDCVYDSGGEYHFISPLCNAGPIKPGTRNPIS